ncbi:MAG: hypothetical protein JHC95_05685 [Solirubrobacteraceae bacterium]|nr:hypothetical protein [Solirubrobacteraceae bacterium]
MSAPAAEAGTTIGSPLSATPIAEWTECDTHSCTVLGPTVTSTGAVASIRVRSAENAQLRLLVLRPQAGAYVLVSSEASRFWAAPDAPTSRVSTPVQGGDVLAVTTEGDDIPPIFAAAPGARWDAFEHDPWTVGVVAAPTFSVPNEDLQMQATVEPDADGDGYGDETQDKCPAEASVHSTTCTSDLEMTASVPATGYAGQAVRHTFVVRNAGPHRARNARLQILSSRIDRVLTGPSPCTPGPASTRGVPFTCALGDLEVGATATVTIDGTGAAHAESATALSDGSDPTPASGWFSTRIFTETQLHPEIGAAGRSKRQRLVVNGRFVTLSIGCRKEAPVECRGRADLVLDRAIGRTSRRIGGGTFVLTPGNWARIRVAVPTRVRRAIRKGRVTAMTRVSYAFGAANAPYDRPATLVLP